MKTGPILLRGLLATAGPICACILIAFVPGRADAGAIDGLQPCLRIPSCDFWKGVDSPARVLSSPASQRQKFLSSRRTNAQQDDDDQSSGDSTDDGSAVIPPVIGPAPVGEWRSTDLDARRAASFINSRTRPPP